MDIQKKRNRFDEIPSSSMSDIAFLLIIFFMVTTVFAVKQGLVTVLPKKDNQPVMLKKEDILSININSAGLISINSTLTDKSNLYTSIKSIIEKNEKVVLVKVDKECEYEHVVDVVSALQKAGVNRMSIKEGNK